MNSTVYNIDAQKAAIKAILVANEKKLSPQFIGDFSNQRIKILNGTPILRKEIKPSMGIQNLIDEDTRKVVGVSDFSEKVISNTEVLIIEKLRIGYCTSLASKAEALGAYKKALPVAFRNATFRIRQDGDVIYETGLSDVFNRYTGTSLEDDYVHLKNPVTLVGGLEIKFELEFGKGAEAHKTEIEYLELGFGGIKLSR
ncbi:hypothetical protein [Tenacibaculum sp. Bg11-29]|uniref:hypothetical protein n=1 Tax=Tenacibaculum sp. Bg11-29 TaxID=2058306 RepID=UPI0012FE8B2F|nr:hypothetical protein [Tenacibaculum sp. Bg11-29]